MTPADELQAELDALNVEMVAKLGLEPTDDWTDFDKSKRETSAWIRHDRITKKLATERSGIRRIAPS